MSAQEPLSVGTPDPKPVPEPSGVDLARVALRAAMKAARERDEAVQQKKRGFGPRSGTRRDGRDPMALGAAINRLITESGWEAPVAVGGVMGRWPQLVGDGIALHCQPESFDEEKRELTICCDSPAWAMEMRLRTRELLARFNKDLGHGTVLLIKVQGPSGPPRRYGPLRVRGSKESWDL